MNAPEKLNSKSELLRKRYGDGFVPAAGPWNDTIAGLVSHRSIRSFKQASLEPGTLETLLAAAQSASTSSNLQAWSVINVTDSAIRRELAEIANNQKHIEECSLFLAWLCDLSRIERVGRSTQADLSPALDLTENFLVGSIDAALAAQNAVVAADSLGLSCVYIGALRNNAQRVAELLKLPPRVVAVFGLCIGYAQQDAAIKPRLPQPAVMFENTYKVTGQESELLKDYDQILGEFSRRQEMVNTTWTERIISRIQGKSLGNRALLRQVLEKLGFPLK